MESCSTCNTPYQLAPRFNVMVPVCGCAALASQAAEDQRRAEYNLDIAKNRVLALNLGLVTPELMAYQLPEKLGSWQDPVAQVKAGQNLFLVGDTGVGKTWHLRAICWHLAQTRKKPTGGYVPTILGRFRDFNNTNVPEYKENIMSGDFLVLDDIDKLLGTQWDISGLLEIVHYFEAHGKSILVTSNRGTRALGVKMRGRGVANEDVLPILSRLQHRATTIEFTGDDLRETTDGFILPRKTLHVS